MYGYHSELSNDPQQAMIGEQTLSFRRLPVVLWSNSDARAWYNIASCQHFKNSRELSEIEQIAFCRGTLVGD